MNSAEPRHVSRDELTAQREHLVNLLDELERLGGEHGIRAQLDTIEFLLND